LCSPDTPPITLESYVDAVAIGAVRTEAREHIAALDAAAELAHGVADTIEPLVGALPDVADDDPAPADKDAEIAAAVDAQHLDFANLETSLEELREGAQAVKDACE
jgi:hypothetical protein